MTTEKRIKMKYEVEILFDSGGGSGLQIRAESVDTYGEVLHVVGEALLDAATWKVKINVRR